MLAAIRSRRGFSLIELVIVVLILGIIAAIAVPRMSRGAKGAQESSVAADLAILRNAIDLYHTEHGEFPADTTIVNQLTQYTDAAGAVSATTSATHIYGPYLRAVPALQVGAEKGNKTIGGSVAVGTAWVYDEDNGTIVANTLLEEDAAGKLFTSY